MSEVVVEISQGIATVTLNRPKSLNAITVEDYEAFANALRDIDLRDDVLVTVWQATGKWFCAGTNVKGARPFVSGSQRNAFLSNVAHTTTDCGRALYSHSKILVAALNGPVMAFLGHFDFIYSVPEAWLSVPFTFLGLVAEGGASVTFANRMGVAKANEVLLWSKKLTAEELVQCGFINKIFPSSSADEFHAAIRRHLQSELEGLDPTALLSVKRLLRAGLDDKNNPDAVNLRESYAQSERFASGIPAERFGQIARREIRHKL
ncbi:ClpP/crotonase-like domain-containing protein [Desarmillaria tabescens]|uniref:ClpP/crotonase-like domain-containing protein n=1 Tax=Armillaria tabescens TaxID=1929756 RepID=A0AA39N6Y2_ARMTA|nr:ClpP/crotonase-like domain-containing protein [Desarmillaria tabescens]KAK0459679.1 ClpP/crotonase-like domain-containing protein [Desarmillaria tabescens]